MLIKLKNFRCHGSDTICEYTFDESGLILLHGASGSGKSTLLKAIIYALYGKVRKPYSFGAKTCSVTLEFMDMIIFRSSSPNRLIVNGLEDEPAQHFINERIGMNYVEFMLSSYIPQKNNSSLLSMSQSDQIEAIKMLAFKDDTANQLHKKAKLMIKQLNDAITISKSKSEFAKNEVDTLSQNLLKIEFPLKLGDSETEQQCIQKYRDRIKTFGTRISELHIEKSTLKKSLSELQSTQEQIDRLIESRDTLKEQMDSQNSVLSMLKSKLADMPIDIDHSINRLKKYIKCLEKRESIETMENSLKTSLKDEISTRRVKISEIDSKLWKRNGIEKTKESVQLEIGNLTATIKSWEEYNTKKEVYNNVIGILELHDTPDVFDSNAIIALQKLLVEKVNTITTNIEALRLKKTEWAIAQDRLKLEKERIPCPNCNAGLRLQNGVLICMDTEGTEHIRPEEIDYQTLINEANTKLWLLESEKKGIQALYSKIETIGIIPNLGEEADDAWYDSLSKKVKKLNKYVTTHMDLELQRDKLQHELNTESFGVTVKNLRETLAKETCKFKELLQKIDVDASKTRDDLEKELSEFQELKTIRSIKVSEISKLEKTICELEEKSILIVKQLVSLNHKLSGINRPALVKKLERIEKKIETATIKQNEDMDISEQVDKYLIYIEQIKKLDEWKTKYENEINELSNLESQLSGFIGLKTLIAKAEVRAENTVIETINEHTRYYLDMFFTEHKMTAIIETSPESKFTNLIEYKGNQYTSIGDLSGGEFDRVTLASVCGINNMLNSPILLLDESLASLDSETNTEIISFLKELSENKLILVCSHEAVTGIFDEIVRF